ncbi:MAG: sodium:proton antiporter [Kangiellaceae bacterium]|jgi:uncharacterized MnhB-related membrane protein|nr:sodium:proton antiporter [Kangiellaceae bacterium]|tara:strand:+ start:6978 stop:7241 length:264 start_codon:yes stop_codon:yes gene_type:complete
MNIDVIMDVILLGSVIGLAVVSLVVKSVFTAIVLYISLGLLVTIIWVRLGAWDVAIAEAAIGAGLTGALLVVAWRKLRIRPHPPKEK